MIQKEVRRMKISYILLVVLLLAFIGFCNYIHIKRVGNNYSRTYVWFKKLLR